MPEIEDCGQDLLLSDSNDSDYTVASDRIPQFDQDDREDNDEPMHNLNDITDEWEQYRHIDMMYLI